MRDIVYIVKKDSEEIGMDSNFNSGKGLVDSFVNKDKAIDCATVEANKCDCRVYVEQVEYETDDFGYIIGKGEPEVIWSSEKAGEVIEDEDKVSDDELAAMEAQMENEIYAQGDMMDQLEDNAMINQGVHEEHEFYKGVDVTEAVAAMGGEDEPLEENIGEDDTEVVADKMAGEYISKDDAVEQGMGYRSKETNDECNEAVESTENAEEEIPTEDVVEEEIPADMPVEEVVVAVEETATEVADMVQEVVEPTEEQEEEIAEKVDEIVISKVEEICPDCEVEVKEEEPSEDEAVEESLNEDKEDNLKNIRAKLSGKSLDDMFTKTEALSEETEESNSTKLADVKAKLRNYQFTEDWTEKPEGQNQPGDAETMAKDLEELTDDKMTNLQPEELKSREDNEAFGYEEPKPGTHSEAEEVNVKEQKIEEDFEIYDFFM